MFFGKWANPTPACVAEGWGRWVGRASGRKEWAGLPDLFRLLHACRHMHHRSQAKHTWIPSSVSVLRFQRSSSPAHLFLYSSIRQRTRENWTLKYVWRSRQIRVKLQNVIQKSSDHCANVSCKWFSYTSSVRNFYRNLLITILAKL